MTDPKFSDDSAPDETNEEQVSGEAPPAGGDEEAAGGEEDVGSVVDEAAWGDDDEDGEDDEPPMHFGAVAHDSTPPIDVPAAGEQAVTFADKPEISHDLIDTDALWVVRRLRAKGYEAYLTGGCVRDLLLNRKPKDFDVATAAHPNQVRAVFRNCRLVGRRFRLAHVFFPNGKVIETATFRANPTDELEDLPQDLLVERDNVFGNVEEDARRRDLTINGLFYDPVAGKVLDFVNGRADLEALLIRTIGDPEIRFQEDPVRILRAIKFATRLQFSIEPQTWAAMCRHVGGLVRCAPARLQEELLRLMTSMHAAESWDLCVKAGVAQVILPELLDVLEKPLEARVVERTVERVVRVVPPPRASRESESGEPSDVAPAEPSDVASAEPSDVASAASSAASSEASPDGSSGVGSAPAAPETAPAPATAEAPAVEHEMLTVPAPAERQARLIALLRSLDDVKQRDTDVSSAAAFAVLLTAAWEALQPSTTSFDQWFSDVADRWTERIRLTRHDRERIPQLLAGQLELLPHRRRGPQARALVHRSSFRESLFLLIVRLHAANQPLDEVGLWKVVAEAAGAGYKQPRTDRPRMRAAGRAPGGSSGGRGRDRGRDRGRRRRR